MIIVPIWYSDRHRATTSRPPLQNTHTHTHARSLTNAHTHFLHASVMYFTSKSWQFSDDIHTPPGSNNISLPPVSIIKYFKQHPASTSVTPSRPMPLSFLSESVSICICHPGTHLRVINRCVRMQNNWCSLGRDWMGLSGAFNQCIFSLSLPPMPLLAHKSQSIVGL